MKVKQILVAGLLAAVVAGPALAASTVNVKLWDKGNMVDLSGHLTWGMGMHGKMNMAMMGVTADRAKVPAGKVTFEVTNTSSGTIHEMLVARINSLNDKLPYIDNQNRVDEEAIKDLGEVSELDPGKSGALTVNLSPGLYLLFCNVPGHFDAGMWTTITVEK